MKQGIFIIVLIFFSISVFSADWPGFRGPGQDSTSSEIITDPKQSLDKSSQLWKIKIGQGYSGITIVGDNLYTMGNTKKEDIIYCINVKDGKTIWTYSYACSTGSYPGPRCSPLVLEGTVYTQSREGHVIALNAADGKLKWQVHLKNNFGYQAPDWGFAGSVIAVGENLILNAGKNGLLLNQKTGKTVWASPKGVSGYASPVIYKAGNLTMAAIFGADKIMGVDVASGKVLWSYNWQTSYDVNAADPLIVGNRIFISSAYNKGCALIEVNDNKPKLIYQDKVFRSHFSSFVYDKGIVYGNDGSPGSGRFKAMDFNSGKELWSQSIGFGSLIATKNQLVLLSERSELIIAEKRSDKYSPLASVRLGSSGYWTAPSIANGKLYVRNVRGDLVCIKIS